MNNEYVQKEMNFEGIITDKIVFDKCEIPPIIQIEYCPPVDIDFTWGMPCIMPPRSQTVVFADLIRVLKDRIFSELGVPSNAVSEEIKTFVDKEVTNKLLETWTTVLGAGLKIRNRDSQND